MMLIDDDIHWMFKTYSDENKKIMFEQPINVSKQTIYILK